MRPYLAIIKDSFREAFASRVLWILLILITLGLALLAPLGFRSELTTEFRLGDFRDARGMAREIMRQYDGGEPSPGFRIAGYLDTDTRQLLTDFGAGEEERGSSYLPELRKVVEGLNGLLAERELYQEEDWKDVLLVSEVRKLLEQESGTLSEMELARRNRLLIETPYEEHFRAQPPKQIVLTYFGAKISPPIRATERRVKQVIERLAIPAVIGIFAGFFGVFAALLVTAPIIPQMFDPGSLSLLLSKPVSRSLTFLTKFVGGCAFIFINVVYLIIGLWAIVGLRFDIWNQGLLLCIPIFLFLFAIYYSVSALAGVIWRNAVVCVVITVVFWFACFVVGAAKGIFEMNVVESERITRLVQAGDSLIALNENGATKYWNSENGEWEDTFIEGRRGPLGRVMGPVYDSENKMILAAQWSHTNMFRSGRPLVFGEESDGWMPVDGPDLPDSTFELLPDPKGRLLAINDSEVYRLAGDFENKKKVQVFFMEISQSLGKPFRPAGPESGLKLNSPSVAAVNHQDASVAIYSRGKLMLLTESNGKYSLAATVDVETAEDDGAVVVFGGSTILLALEDGRVLNYRAPELELRQEFEPESASPVRFAIASPDAKWFGLVFHNGRLHMLDAKDPEKPVVQLAEVRGQGDISAVHFAKDETLLVADRVKRVSEYRLDSFERTTSFAPSLTPLEIAYYYFVLPVYTVFPKPSELDNTIQYVLKKQDTVELTLPQGDLQAKRAKLRPWAPVQHSLIFITVVLLVACIYIERQDF